MMIKINLLPIESFRQTQSGQLSVTIFAFVVVALLIALYFFKSLIMDTKVQAMETNRGSLSAKLEDLKKTSAEALKQTTEFTDQLIKVSAFSDIEEKRRDQTRLLTTLSSLVNSQASWLVSIKHENNILNLKGLATDMQVVAELQTALQNCALLQNVILIKTSQDNTYPGIRLFAFELRADTVFPQSTLLQTGLPDVNLPPRDLMVQVVSAAAPTLGENLKKSAQGPNVL
jgi:Tfp pilus assembly protein PilN